MDLAGIEPATSSVPWQPQRQLYRATSSYEYSPDLTVPRHDLPLLSSHNLFETRGCYPDDRQSALSRREFSDCFSFYCLDRRLEPPRRRSQQCDCRTAPATKLLSNSEQWVLTTGQWDRPHIGIMADRIASRL